MRLSMCLTLIIEISQFLNLVSITHHWAELSSFWKINSSFAFPCSMVHRYTMKKLRVLTAKYRTWSHLYSSLTKFIISENSLRLLALFSLCFAVTMGHKSTKSQVAKWNLVWEPSRVNICVINKAVWIPLLDSVFLSVNILLYFL